MSLYVSQGSFFRGVVVVFLALVGMAQVGWAQSLKGVVTDPSGAAVVGARVTVVNRTLHVTRSAATNASGAYGFSSVAAGSYTVTVEANNFSRYEGSAVVDARDVTVDVKLQVSSVSQSVTVTSDHTSLEEVSTTDKTDTKLEDLPGSIGIIPREVLNQQGATMLRQAAGNASGINYGGQDSKGFYDHFEIRGLDAMIYSDGFRDGDQLGGISHSLNGVERVEILEGPGSALFGSGAPGGTINIVHYTPSSTPYYGLSLQGGSFGTVVTNDFLTGPTGIKGLSYRVDTMFAHSNGFRSLASHDFEGRSSLEWQTAHHVTDFALDLRHIHETPDSYGVLYLNGTPISSVPNTAKYSTPFATSNEPFVRPTVTDAWMVGQHLTINNRFSYLYRSLTFLGNGDSTRTQISGGQVIGRQLRQQHDVDGSYDYQFEPVWKFNTGPIHHTLLTGFEFLRQTIGTKRSTADLPSIPDAFAPVPPETSAAGLQFLCDSKHSCDQDQLSADFYGAYVTDQVDVTEKLKLRAGVRQDWFNRSLTPLIPGQFSADLTPLPVGVTDSRRDTPASWNAGILYKVLPSVIPYFGASSSHLANFDSESTQNGLADPESALQYEAGIKFPLLNNKIALNTAFFDVNRNNVPDFTTNNVGTEIVLFDSQRTRGFEASLDGTITPQWHILMNGTEQDAVVTSSPQSVTTVGHHPQGVPADMMNVWSTYRFSKTAGRGFEVGAGMNYIAKSFSDTNNVSWIPSSYVANATVGYARAAWSFRVNVDNFTNRRYFVAPNAAGAYMGNPASAYGQITWNPRLHSR